MILRLLLVGVVSGLGIQPPSADTLRSWADEGRDWWVARAADWNDTFMAAATESVTEAETTREAVPPVDDFLADVPPSPVSPTECCVAEPVPAAVETPACTATEPKCDVPAPAEEPVAPAPAADCCAPAPTAEPIANVEPAPASAVETTAPAEPDADALFAQAQESMVAEFLADAAVTQPSPELIAVAPVDSIVAEGDACETNLIADEPVLNPNPEAEAAPKIRLARALKLTGDAFHAWADLLQGKRDQPTYQ